MKKLFRYNVNLGPSVDGTTPPVIYIDGERVADWTAQAFMPVTPGSEVTVSEASIIVPANAAKIARYVSSDKEMCFFIAADNTLVGNYAYLIREIDATINISIDCVLMADPELG